MSQGETWRKFGG